jgi:hypothetical protein
LTMARVGGFFEALKQDRRHPMFELDVRRVPHVRDGP